MYRLDVNCNIMQNSAATLDFDRSDFAVYLGESKQSPLSLGTVPKSAKTFLPRIPLVSTVKQCSVFKGFFSSKVAVERRYRQFSAATLHADMLDKPALNGRGFARCSNRLLQGYEALPIDLATSERNSPSVTERLFHTANAVKVK